jgi:hypothetical protein
MTSTSEAAKARRTAARVASAPNEKVAEIMAIEDPDERWEKLREAGYCGYAAGSCRADNGKIARRWKDEKGKVYVECKFHTLRSYELNKKYRRDGSLPEWRKAIKEVVKTAADDPNWLQLPAGLRRKKRRRKADG